MPPDSARRFGQCEVLSLVGAGGMGEVYKAKDTRLGRDVALKVLPKEFASDPDRMARLEREARILATLNHPNIASIYSVEDGGGERALIMEYVEGPTLAERMRAGPMPPEEALAIAQQIVDALDYAHERGVIHRDLKPANIKLTADGAVKVLDFGLAKAMEDNAAASNPDVSPTLSAAATRAGVILGTAAYMSPEQARGRPADRRADIWAFGVVLFEMLSGQRLFDGETVSDSLASVLKEPIDWSRLPAHTPPAILRLLRRCLERDRKLRLQHIGDGRLEIREALEETPAAPLRRRSATMPWAVAAVLALTAVLAITGWWGASRPVQQRLTILPVDLGANAFLTPVWGPNVIISPDGRRLAYLVEGRDGQGQLAVRTLDRPEPSLLAGTEGASSPFFSPDGQWVAFFGGQRLKKVSVTGGVPVEVCESGSISVGGSWGDDGTIVAALGPRQGLSKVSSAGGKPESVTQPDERTAETSHRWPQILPGGVSVLYTAGTPISLQETGRIVVQSLKDSRRKVLWRGGYHGRYLPTGHLVYVHRGTLFAVRFDADKWELLGTPAPVLEQVLDNPQSGAGQFDISRTGTLIYTSGRGSGYTTALMWSGDNGELAALPAPPDMYLNPRVSPDGERIALIRVVGQVSDLWVYEWRRDIMNRLTVGPEIEYAPVWTPDGKYIAFSTDRAIYCIRADGAGTARRLTDNEKRRHPSSFSPDGKRLAFVEFSPQTGWDIFTLPIAWDGQEGPKAGKPELFLSTPFTEWAPAFSPDGRWVAYSSAESGPIEVQVRPFPKGDARWQVSSGGGWSPVWSRSGPELYYQTPDGRIVAVRYAAKDGAFVPESRRLWTETLRVAPVPISRPFDVTPRGNRLLVQMLPSGEQAAKNQLNFCLNFFEELRRRVP